jgi:integral membrane protein
MPNSQSTARAVEPPVSGQVSSAAVSALERLRRVGKLEAVSFLVLLGIAMPLKYLAHWPLAVKLVGWVHGMLFVWFSISLWRAKRDARLSFGQAFVILLAAFLPFGPFVIDRRLAREAAARAPS